MMNSLSTSVRLAKMSCTRRVLLGSFHSCSCSSLMSIYMVLVLPVKGDTLITSLIVLSYQKMHVIVNPSQSDTKLANGIHFMLPWGVEMCLSRTHWQPPIENGVYAYSMGLRGAEILSEGCTFSDYTYTNISEHTRLNTK